MKIWETKIAKEHNIYNPQTFIYAFQELQPKSHYFDKDTLHFFGERVSEMELCANTETVKDSEGIEHEVFCLYSRQRNAPYGVSQDKYSYFDIDTLEVIYTG